MGAAFLKWLSERLPDWIRRDWFHVMKAKRSVAGVAILCMMFGFVAGRLWAAYSQADSSLWRLSNFTLKQRTIEFSSRLREFAAKQMMELNAAAATPHDIGPVSMKFRAEYAKEYRPSAIELREALENRTCGNYKPRDRLTLDFEYDLGESAYEVSEDLEKMANDLCWHRSFFPRIEAFIFP
jgi:hypothetical protein